MEASVRTIDGEIVEIMERISSTGGAVVELHLATSSGKEKFLAYEDKATAIQSLSKKMQDLVTKNGVAHIRDLHVRVEISGIVKAASSSKDTIVTGIKILQ